MHQNFYVFALNKRSNNPVLAEKWNITIVQPTNDGRRSSRRQSLLTPFDSAETKNESAYEEIPDLAGKKDVLPTAVMIE